MSGIARVLLASGFSISGSDLCESSETINLRKLGAQIFIGHDQAHVGDAQLMVYSSAVNLKTLSWSGQKLITYLSFPGLQLAAGPAGAPPKPIRASRPGPASAAGPVQQGVVLGRRPRQKAFLRHFPQWPSRPARARIQNEGQIVDSQVRDARRAQQRLGLLQVAVRRTQPRPKFIFRRLQAGQQGIGRGNVRFFLREPAFQTRKEISF